jgi:hypothetical protein
MSVKNIVYFERSGLKNTDRVLNLVAENSNRLEINTVVLASTRGGTAEKAFRILKGKMLIVVGIDRDRFSTDLLNTAESIGIPVIFSHETIYDYPIDMKTAFRRFSQGMKVAVEDVVVACTQGVLEDNIDVISLAGSSWGADTAIVIKSASNFSDVRIKNIICMPQ